MPGAYSSLEPPQVPADVTTAFSHTSSSRTETHSGPAQTAVTGETIPAGHQEVVIVTIPKKTPNGTPGSVKFVNGKQVSITLAT